MEDDGLTPKKLERLVGSAVNPTVAYRKEICRRLARQIYNQFGPEGLYDLLNGIDDIGNMASIVIAEKNEIENYLFQTHGIFDQDIFEKILLSDEWDDLIANLIEDAGERVAGIIDSIIENEKG